MLLEKKNHSLKKILRYSLLLIIGIMIIPTIYSLIVFQIHTKRYDAIISNVNQANKINLIAKNDIPNELWEIVCGKKDFLDGSQYEMIHEISRGIEEIQNRSPDDVNYEKLEVANRACTTLSKNVIMLEDQIEAGASVTENEKLLEEIRTITALFSDIIQDYVISEIESANITNQAIRRSTVKISILQIIIVLLSLFVSVTSYFYVSRSITNPIDDMQKLSAEIARGNFIARTPIPRVDEFEPLAIAMNRMTDRIDVLIKKNKEEQENCRKAEMKALQAQITPHFLYNTFDTIIWLAEEEDTERVVQITKAFSEFLRISLSRGHEWITVQQEVDHIKNYLTIQKIRYNDILNYEIYVDEALANTRIIKLLLQPLVENAIYHGIKNKRGRGHLEVRVNFYDETRDKLLITVKDDGAGFTPERLAEVEEELRTVQTQEKLSAVYGMYNVNKKLKLYYGSRTSGLIIKSEQNKGTEISFIIPCIREGEIV